jgi:hypothetical protein
MAGFEVTTEAQGKDDGIGSRGKHTLLSSAALKQQSRLVHRQAM